MPVLSWQTVMEINVLIDEGLEGCLDVAWLESVAAEVLLAEGTDPGSELGLVITDQEKIQELNLVHLGEDEPTDVLSFPMLPDSGDEEESEIFVTPPDGIAHLGEVIISYPQAVIQAEERGHSVQKEVATLAILKVQRPRSVGVVEMDADARVLSFTEHPAERAASADLESGGTYVLERTVLDHIPVEHPSDFGHDVFPALLARDLPVYGYILKDDDYLVDIGTIEKYRQANEDMAAGRIRIGHGE